MPGSGATSASLTAAAANRRAGAAIARPRPQRRRPRRPPRRWRRNSLNPPILHGGGLGPLQTREKMRRKTDEGEILSFVIRPLSAVLCRPLRGDLIDSRHHGVEGEHGGRVTGLVVPH